MTEPAPVKLTPSQAALLRRIVATNGGGIVGGFHEASRQMKMIRRLENLGLVQGKKSAPSIVVHTRAGLEWVRANPTQ
jgi:hypothetical protein